MLTVIDDKSADNTVPVYEIIKVDDTEDKSKFIMFKIKDNVFSEAYNNNIVYFNSLVFTDNSDIKFEYSYVNYNGNKYDSQQLTILDKIVGLMLDDLLTDNNGVLKSLTIDDNYLLAESVKYASA